MNQPTEQALHTILKISMGVYFNTHDLDKLIRYSSMVSYTITDIFSRISAKNERLFQLLQRAYIDSRYKEDYLMRTDDLILLTDKVRTLLDILKNVKQVQ